MKIHGEDYAFPSNVNGYNPEFGMTTRLYIATMAMQGICVSLSYNSPIEIAKKAFEIADELLKQESE